MIVIMIKMLLMKVGDDEKYDSGVLIMILGMFIIVIVVVEVVVIVRGMVNGDINDEGNDILIMMMVKARLVVVLI